MNYKILVLLIVAILASVTHSFTLRQEIDDDNPIHINPGPDPFENKTDPFSPFNPDNIQNETEPVGPEKNKTDPIGPEKNKTDPVGPEKNHTDEDPSRRSKVNATVFMNETFYTGYMPINVEEKEYLYFVMVESRNNPDTDPLIIWLQGECSSQIGMFTEHGPFNVGFNLTSRPVFNMTRNNYSWNSNATVVYIDYPLGTGFSYSPSFMNYRFLDSQLQEDFYIFLEGIMRNFPKYKGRNLYLAGEGLAGHIIPIVSKYIINQGNPDIELFGVAIGNGWVDPFYQLPAHNQYAIDSGIINAGRGFLLSLGYKLCEFMMLTEIPILSQSICYLAELAISGNPIYPSFNPFDVREPCEHMMTCVDNSKLALFLNNGPFHKVSSAMGQWDECDDTVRLIMLYYAQFNYGYMLSELLDNDVAVLVYNGDKDYMANWMGAQAWTEALPWRYQDQFVQETFTDWRINNKTEELGGQVKNFQLLSLFKIFDAGKMVPKDKPELALQMINEFMSNGRLIFK